MSFAQNVNTGSAIGLPVENIDVFVWNRNPRPTETSAAILPGQVVAFAIWDASVITGDGLTPAIGHSRYANIFGNVTKDYSSTAHKYALCGVALERIDCSTSTSGPRGGRVRVRGIVEAYVRTTTSTAHSPGYACVIDSINKGYLDCPSSLNVAGTSAVTAKVIALTLEDGPTTAFGVAFAAAQLEWVLFDGLNGFGGNGGEFNL